MTVAATSVAIVDYGAGNLVSICNALQLLGAEPSVASEPADLDGADVILVPGVGASAPAMARLERQGLVGPIAERVHAGTWYIGICLGLQLLFERSHEDDAEMFGLLEGDVVRIANAPSLPHIGWNRVQRRQEHGLLADIGDGFPAYFVHSYVPAPRDGDVIVAQTEHGATFPSIVATDHIMGFQFHPERSGDDGLQLLRNALGLIGADAATTASTMVAL